MPADDPNDDGTMIEGRAPSVFRNPDDGRLKAGWRILSFLFLLYALALPLLFGLRAVFGFSKSSPWVIVLIAGSATAAVVLARRWIDGRSTVSLGLAPGRTAVVDLVCGFVLSAMMAASVLGLLALLGLVDDLTVAALDAAGLRALSMSLVIFALVAFWEELVFRGYILQNMMEGLGKRPAILVSCAIYGLIHAMNPNATLLSSAIIVVFGYLRIYGYLSTGQLWLSIGMHWGWNFCQATVFGFAASGHAEDWSLVTHRLSGESWLSGGDFGPEGSVLVLPAVLAAILIMRIYTSKRRGAGIRQHTESDVEGTKPSRTSLVSEY